MQGNVAEFQVTVNGSPLSDNYQSALLEIVVQEELNLPTMFNLRIATVNTEDDEWQGLDLTTFKPGVGVTIALGLNAMTPLVSGKVTSVEPYFGEQSYVDVRGYDSMINLYFGTAIRTFLESTDSTIAETVATAANLKAVADQTTVVYPMVLQNKVNNYQFLMSRANRINYEMLYRDGVLRFRKSAEGSSPVRTLKYAYDFEQLNLQLGVVMRGDQVSVTYWDSTQKKAFTANADQETGGFAYNVGFPSGRVTLNELYTPDMAAANQFASGIQDERQETFIAGSGICTGDPDLSTGTNVTLSGLGSSFSGSYYLTGTRHRYSPDEGYVTTFKVRRTSI